MNHKHRSYTHMYLHAPRTDRQSLHTHLAYKKRLRTDHTYRQIVHTVPTHNACLHTNPTLAYTLSIEILCTVYKYRSHTQIKYIVSHTHTHTQHTHRHAHHTLHVPIWQQAEGSGHDCCLVKTYEAKSLKK